MLEYELNDSYPNILLSLVIEIIFLPNPLLRIRSRDHHRRRQRLPHIHSRFFILAHVLEFLLQTGHVFRT